MDPGRTKIILVGNSEFPRWGGYESKNIPNVDQNIENLKKLFFHPDYFGIPKDQEHFVEIKDETSQEILLRVKHETKSFANKDQFDRLIFYYSGHGIPGEDKKLFFASKDTVRTDYEITAVDSNRLFSYLKSFNARQLIVILDCCYAAQTKENQGDADSLIEKCLPEQKEQLENNEPGAYYLFAAGKDNVAKFNPKEPKNPTFFTEALLNAVNEGTDPEDDFLTMEQLYTAICSQIINLKKKHGTEIPDPRTVMEGYVSNYHFCRNIRFKDQEMKDWEEIRRDPNLKKLESFEQKYPHTRFETEKDNLRFRIIEGLQQIKKIRTSNNLTLANKIKIEYKDIPFIKEAANLFMREMAAKAIADENEIENSASTSKVSHAAVSEASLNLTQATNKNTEATSEKSSLKEAGSTQSERTASARATTENS